MNTYRLDLELNILLAQMWTDKTSQVKLAFFRAFLLSQYPDRAVQEEVLEQVQFVVANREKLQVEGKYLEFVI